MRRSAVLWVFLVGCATGAPVRRLAGTEYRAELPAVWRAIVETCDEMSFGRSWQMPKDRQVFWCAYFEGKDSGGTFLAEGDRKGDVLYCVRFSVVEGRAGGWRVVAEGVRGDTDPRPEPQSARDLVGDLDGRVAKRLERYANR